MPGTPNDLRPLADIAANNASSDEVAKIAIQDTARYQEQLLKLIFFHDEKGHKVLSIYVTVIAAIVTGCFALNQVGKFDLYAKLFLGGNAVTFLFGCVWAYITAWKAPIYIPGRKPDFWIWALENEQTVRESTLAYLNQSIDVVSFNEKLNDRSSNRLSKAYSCGLAAPLVGGALVWLAYWGGL